MYSTPAKQLKTENDAIQQAIEQVSSVLYGKNHQIKLALSCLLANGHLLIEDLPGVGKTTLAHALAAVLSVNFQRIQFTSDLLPADIIGLSVFQRETNSFEFHPGPIFANLILADEVNRATPKTQSALLEAMEERQVTVEGETRALNTPFFVIATQNPQYQIGTFPLPESQLDRFLMRIKLGYPDSDAERLLLEGTDPRTRINDLLGCLPAQILKKLQQAVEQVTVSTALLDYLQRLLQHSRQSEAFQTGLSPRAGLALRRAAQAWAFLHQRHFVLPEDLKAILYAVATHRLMSKEHEPVTDDYITHHLIQAVAID